MENQLKENLQGFQSNNEDKIRRMQFDHFNNLIQQQKSMENLVTIVNKNMENMKNDMQQFLSFLMFNL